MKKIKKKVKYVTKAVEETKRKKKYKNPHAQYNDY